MSSFWTRVNTVLLLMILVGGALAMASRAWGGPLDPPGPPGSTLPQVEPRVPLPPVGWNGTDTITINQPGSYFLTRNISMTSGNAIVLDANDVTLDLNGFAITGTANPSAGIAATGALRTGVVIRNGHVRAFDVGLYLPSLSRSRVEDIEVEGAAKDGIVIGSGGTVRNVMTHDNVQAGIRVVQAASNFGTLISDSNASLNGFGAQFETAGIYIQANNVWVRNSIMDSNKQSGVGVATGWSYNQITDNRITSNLGSGVAISGVGSTNYNMVARNVIIGNSNPVTDFGTFSRIGTFVGGDASITATNPWSNVVY